MVVAAVTFNSLSILFTPSEDVIKYGKFSPFQPNRKISPIKKAKNGSICKVTLVKWTSLTSGYYIVKSCIFYWIQILFILCLQHVGVKNSSVARIFFGGLSRFFENFSSLLFYNTLKMNISKNGWWLPSSTHTDDFYSWRNLKRPPLDLRWIQKWVHNWMLCKGPDFQFLLVVKYFKNAL